MRKGPRMGASDKRQFEKLNYRRCKGKITPEKVTWLFQAFSDVRTFDKGEYETYNEAATFKGVVSR